MRGNERGLVFRDGAWARGSLGITKPATTRPGKRTLKAVPAASETATATPSLFPDGAPDIADVRYQHAVLRAAGAQEPEDGFADMTFSVPGMISCQGRIDRHDPDWVLWTGTGRITGKLRLPRRLTAAQVADAFTTHTQCRWNSLSEGEPTDSRAKLDEQRRRHGTECASVAAACVAAIRAAGRHAKLTPGEDWTSAGDFEVEECRFSVGNHSWCGGRDEFYADFLSGGGRVCAATAADLPGAVVARADEFLALRSHAR